VPNRSCLAARGIPRTSAYRSATRPGHVAISALCPVPIVLVVGAALSSERGLPVGARRRESHRSSDGLASRRCRGRAVLRRVSDLWIARHARVARGIRDRRVHHGSGGDRLASLPPKVRAVPRTSGDPRRRPPPGQALLGAEAPPAREVAAKDRFGPAPRAGKPACTVGSRRAGSGRAAGASGRARVGRHGRPAHDGRAP
jgi:hypothetical protein